MMHYLELHFHGNPRLIAAEHIACLGSDQEDTYIWLDGADHELYVDESYEQIKSKLQEVGFIWNV